MTTPPTNRDELLLATTEYALNIGRPGTRWVTYGMPGWTLDGYQAWWRVSAEHEVPQ